MKCRQTTPAEPLKHDASISTKAPLDIQDENGRRSVVEACRAVPNPLAQEQLPFHARVGFDLKS